MSGKLQLRMGHVGPTTTVTAICPIWSRGGTVTEAVIKLARASGSHRIDLRTDVFARLAAEQSMRSDYWHRLEFVLDYHVRIGRRAEP